MRDLFRRLSVLRLGAVLLVLSAVVTSGCDALRGASGRAEDQDYQNFVDLAERADELGVTPYWLGRSFEAGGLLFEGPGVADFGADVTGGGISMSYAARLSGGSAPLYLKIYSPSAWKVVEHGIMQPRDRTTRRNVVVMGHDAEMLILSAGTRPVNGVRIVVHFGETTVFANANSVGGATEGGPDLNPLVDPDTLLAVMEQLRVWPE